MMSSLRSDQDYNEYLEHRERAAGGNRDPRWGFFGYSRDGWPFTPARAVAKRCPRCARRISRCKCPPEEAAG